MFKMARFFTLTGLGLAISSFVGLMAKHLPVLAIGLWVLFLLMILLTSMSWFAGPLLDHHFGWTQDTSFGLSIALLLIFIIGSLIGWLIS
jgi:hypothetical protein